MRTEFFMPMVPPTKTHQEKQVRVVKGKPVFYEPAELQAVRSKLIANLAQHIPAQKYTEAIRLVTKWCFPITGKHLDGEYKITKPDTDNLQKMLKDCMTDLGYWTDDALVASEITEKFWAKVPGIYIEIVTLRSQQPFQAKAEYYKNSVEAFCSENVEATDLLTGINKQTFYKFYTEWCKNQEINPVSQTKLKAILKQIFPRIEEGRDGNGGPRMWLGIKMMWW